MGSPEDPKYFFLPNRRDISGLKEIPEGAPLPKVDGH